MRNARRIGNYVQELANAQHVTRDELAHKLNCTEYVSRFPLPYLKSVFYGNSEAEELLDAISSCEELDLAELFNDLRAIIIANDTLYRRIHSDIQHATALASRMASRDYKTLVPCYFPKGNHTSFMLPLYLSGDEAPDLALVVNLTEAGNYQGQTILTMEQAYIDARLVCRISNNWIANSKCVS